MDVISIAIKTLKPAFTKDMFQVFTLHDSFYLYVGQYDPQLNATIGTNYFDQEFKMLKVLVRGSEPVEIRTAPVIFVSFELPTMTEEEFFGDNLVNNLAAFLKVPANMIRVTNIIREDGGARRRKRSSGLKVELEIKKPPVQQTTNTTDGEPKEQRQWPRVKA